MAIINENLEKLAQRVGEVLKKRKYLLATAESCTGGGIGQVLTAIPGSSLWYERGFITYSNLAKEELLGVSATTLAIFGAVSDVTVMEMANGALARSHAQVALAVSGIAGPDGGSPDKPVGSVHFAWTRQNGPTRVIGHWFSGDRAAVRHQSIVVALEGILEMFVDY
ncbi:Nicotinamide-nucleotide amidohydrolase PncC [Gammaproteobacteria bacterium]